MTEEDVDNDFDKDFARCTLLGLAHSIGPGFHPDTFAADYVSRDDSPTMLPSTADLFDKNLEFCRRVLGDEIYTIALEYLNTFMESP